MLTVIYMILKGWKNIDKNRSVEGVAICIKASIEYTTSNDLNTFNEHIESVFVETHKEHMNAKNIVIGVIYRIPCAMKQVHMAHKLMYLIGDYNIDLSNLEKKNHVLTTEFADVLYCNDFFHWFAVPRASLAHWLHLLIIYSQIIMMI